MALAPRSQEFFEIREALGSLIEQGLIKDETQYESILEEAGISPAEFDMVEADYLKNRGLIEAQVKAEQEGIASYLPDVGAVLAPAGARLGTGLKNLLYTGTGLASFPVTFGAKIAAGEVNIDNVFEKAGEALDEPGELIGSFVEDAAKTIDDKLLESEYGKQLSYAVKEIADPRRTATEDLVGDIGGFLVGYGLTRGRAKGLQPTSKLGKAGKEAGVAITADVLLRDSDEQFTMDLLNIIPELEDDILAYNLDPSDNFAKASLKTELEKAGPAVIETINQLKEQLKLNPEDTGIETKLKQTIDSALGLGLITGTLAGGFKLGGLGFRGLETLTSGGAKIANKAYALTRQNILEPIAQTPTVMTAKAKVVETIPGTFKQGGTAYEIIGNVNTALGRGLTSAAAMPKELFNASLEQTGKIRGAELKIDAELKKLSKLTKKTDDNADISRVFMGEAPLKPLSSEVAEQVSKMRDDINANQGTLKERLGVSDDSKLGIMLDDVGNAYITRAFEFTTNPQWSKDIKNILNSGDIAGRGVIANTAKKLRTSAEKKAHNSDMINIVNEARTHFKKKYKNKNLSDSQIDALIEDVIDYGKKSKSPTDFLKAVTGAADGQAAIKILKQRKKIDAPILKLMGEIKDPFRQYQNTMRNQNKLIARTEFFEKVKGFAEQNLNKPIPLGGFFPGLPTKQAKFFKSDVVGERGVNESLKEYVEKEIASFGGKADIDMGNIYTTPTMLKMIDEGIDWADNWFAPSVFTNSMGIAQSSETVLDHTAHMLNSYGAAQALAMNGNLFNRNILKGAEEGASLLYEKAIKKDPEALARLQRLKEYGVIDASIVSEGIQENLGRHSQGIQKSLGDTIKAPFKGAAAAYGGADDFAKIVALESEMARYAKAFPNMTPLELERYAAQRIVRNVMPSYSTAAPLVRGLARLPVGTYATFPAEVLRTTKNIIKIGLEDIKVGRATNNKALLEAGRERLASLSGLTVGIGAAVAANNAAMGVTDNEIRAINMIVAEFSKTSSKFVTSPLKQDPKTGDIMVSYIDTGMLDSLQSIKGPLSSILGRALAGKDITQRELDDMFTDAAREVYSPYISNKFVTQAIIDIIRGETEFGTPIRGVSGGAEQIIKAFTPGTVKAYNKMKKAYESEMLEGEGYGRSAAGFPLRYEDQRGFFFSGVRNNTLNFDKSVSMSLFNDVKEIQENRKIFLEQVKRVPQRIVTEEDALDIFNARVDMLNKEKKLMARLKDKIEVIADAEYFTNKKDKDGDQIKKRYGYDGVLKAASSKGEYKVNENILKALGPDAVYNPEVFEEKNMIKFLKDRKFPMDIIDGIFQIDQAYRGDKYYPEEQE